MLTKDLGPFTVAPVLSKVMYHVCPHLYPLQIAYLAKRTSKDAINTLHHHTTHHLDQKDAYISAIPLH